MSKYAELINQIEGLKNAIETIEKGVDSKQDGLISTQKEYMEEKVRLISKEISHIVE